MEILQNILLVLHFVGLAAILGGVLVQSRAMFAGTARVMPAILHGAWLQLVSGLLLVLVIELSGGSINNAKIGVKLLVLIAIFVIAYIFKKREKPPAWVVPTIGGLAVANIVIAVFW